MEPTTQTSKEYFKALLLLHTAFIAGQVCFGLIVSFLVVSGKVNSGSADLSVVFAYVVPIFVLIGLSGSNYIYKSKLSKLRSSNDLKYKMFNYRVALIIRYAFLEGPTLFAIIVALLTGNLIFLVFAGLLLSFMIYWRPVKNRIIADLGLSTEEVAIINDPDSIIAEFNGKRS
ncbi:MAG TPA: hypothetical protein PLD84_06050 [Chitinophagales bacterium]|nr:hypothetical protein [Chitinophagales bacterium]